MKPYLLCPLFFHIAKQIAVLLHRYAVGGMPIFRTLQSPVHIVRDVNKTQRAFLESLVLDFTCA